MAKYDIETRQLTDIENPEVVVSGLTEFTTPDLDGYTRTFYDAGSKDSAYTLMSLLEWYYQNHREVRITIEDVGEDPFYLSMQQMSKEAAEKRQVALEKLNHDRPTRKQRITKYTSS